MPSTIAGNAAIEIASTGAGPRAGRLLLQDGVNEVPLSHLSDSSRSPTAAGRAALEPQTLELPPPLAGTLSGREFWTGSTIHLAGAGDLAPRSGPLLDL